MGCWSVVSDEGHIALRVRSANQLLWAARHAPVPGILNDASLPNELAPAGYNYLYADGILRIANDGTPYIFNSYETISLLDYKTRIWVPVDVTNPNGIFISGEQYLFSAAITPWVVQQSNTFLGLFRFEVRPGFRAPFDEDRNRPYIRTELNGVTNYSGAVWAAFDWIAPSISNLLTDPSDTTMIFQIKARSIGSKVDPGAPVVRIDALATGIYVRISGTTADPPPIPYSTTVTQLSDVPPLANTAERFVIYAKPGAGTGELKVWRNGVLVLNLSGVVLGYVGYSVYTKFGIYADDKIAGLVTNVVNIRQSASDLSSLVTNPPAIPVSWATRGSGGNLISNSDFSSGNISPWEQRLGSVYVVGGRMRVQRVGTNAGRARYTLNGLTVGANYTLRVDRYNGTRPSNRVVFSSDPTNLSVGVVLDDTRSGTVGYQATVVPTNTTMYLFLTTPSGVDGDYNEFDNIQFLLA